MVDPTNKDYRTITKVILNKIGAGYRSSNALNNDFDLIEEGFERSLSRIETDGNQMETPLDMNSKPILNLPAPQTETEPLRLGDLTVNLEEIASQVLPTKADVGGGNITEAQTWRTSLGLGDSATRDIGTGPGTVASGDDTRIVNAQQNTFVSAPAVLRGVENKLTQDFHFFDIVTSPADQAAIRAGASATDWSDAMDEALARLLVANQDDPGKAMTLPDGEIRLSRTLVKPYGAGLFGRGREFTRIISTTGAGHGIVVPEFDRGAVLSGFTIERNVTSTPGTYGLYLSHGTSGMLIDRIAVRRFANGIFAGSTDYGTVVQPEIDDCYGDGWVQMDTKSFTDLDIPGNYDPAVQWQLEKPLVRWCQGVAYKATANPSGRGHIAGEWRNPGTFENGQTMLIAGVSPSIAVNDIRVNDGFVGSDNFGCDVEAFGKNNEFSFNAIERMGLDSYGPRFNPDGTPRTRSTPGGTGYGRGFRLGTNNLQTKLSARIDDTAGYGAVVACDAILDLSIRNPGISADANVGVIQFAGSLAGQVVVEATATAVQFTTDEAHVLSVSGGAITGAATPTSSLLTPGGFRDSLKINGSTLLVGRDSGFTAMTGTPRKTSFSSYDGGTAEGAYTQAQIQGIMDSLKAVSERLKAYDDALIASKIPGA